MPYLILTSFLAIIAAMVLGAYQLGKAQAKTISMPPRDEHGRFLSRKRQTTAALKAELEGKGAA